MAIGKTKPVCPYCLQEIRAGDLKYVCPRCGAEAVQTTMERLTGRVPKCKDPGCHGSLASDRVCRSCESKLPADILDYNKYLRFSIIGIPGSGKTNFLTTMLHELRNAPGIPWTIAPMDSQTGLMFQENDRSVYENRRPVPATPPGMPPQPQQWRIRDRSKMTNTTIPSYSMTIFDGAGEDHQRIDPVISRYISGSKVLLILIDPLALNNVKRSIPNDILNWSTASMQQANASTDMVDGLTNYIRTSCGIPGDRLIDRDVAVVFTKIDAVAESFGTATVMQPSPHLARKGFVKADSDAVNLEIRSWLERNHETAFLAAIEGNFRSDRIRFFGVSSFGQPPTGSESLGQVLPHRVLDPLMWMLSKEGIVPTL